MKFVSQVLEAEKKYGEGSNGIEVGNYSFHHNNHFAQIRYGVEDVRFTTLGNNLYVTFPEKPEGFHLLVFFPDYAGFAET